eukprot:8518377-Pyramimonas_sp.AAC.1
MHGNEDEGEGDNRGDDGEGATTIARKEVLLEDLNDTVAGVTGDAPDDLVKTSALQTTYHNGLIFTVAKTAPDPP